MKREDWEELSMAQKHFNDGIITKDEYDVVRVKHGIDPLKLEEGQNNVWLSKDIIDYHQLQTLKNRDPRKMINFELCKEVHMKKLLKVFSAVMEAIHGVSPQGMQQLRTDLSIKFDGKHLPLINVMLMLRNTWKVDDYQMKYAYNKIVREVVATVLIKINDEILQELEV